MVTREEYMEALQVVERYHKRLNLEIVMAGNESKKLIRDWINEFDSASFLNTYPITKRMTIKKCITRIKKILNEYERITGDRYIEEVRVNELIQYRNFGSTTRKVYLKMISYGIEEEK